MQYISTVIISAALAAAVWLIIRGMRKAKKAGKSCSCSCESCALCGQCHSVIAPNGQSRNDINPSRDL